MEKKEVYFNRPQRLTQLIGANTTVIVAGRRTGKTDSIATPFVWRNVQRMPGSTGAIVVPTFKHGLTNTIPGVVAALRRWGAIEGIHFVVGKNPPDFFARPIIPPLSYEHVISFYNGSIAVLISQDRIGSSNGLTLSWVLVDEAKFIDYTRLKDETLPANGGIKNHFGKRSCNHSLMILSDMPQTQKGSWFLNYREKMDAELITVIQGLVYEIYELKKRRSAYMVEGRAEPDHIRRRLRQLDTQLNQLRSVAVYYREYSSIENLQLLGEKYIAQMKRDLTPLTFRTSILCERLGLMKDGFYSSMREGHKYNASDFDVLDESFRNGSWSELRGASLTSESDRDVDPDAPICIGMDYNANINWIVAGQPSRGRLNVLKSFYVKFERKLPELVSDFCTYYSTHRNKTVVFYYDSTALGSNYAVNDRDFRRVIIDEFERHGWDVFDETATYVGAPMKHHEKHLLINEGFSGKRRLTPYFNRQNNDDLLIAIQSAGIERGRNGFRKNKAGEKVPETEENLLEHRTDGTDAFDTLYIGCELFPVSGADSNYSLIGIL